MGYAIVRYYILIALYTTARCELTVQTSHGEIRGISQTAATGKKVNAWYGIPYAEKPIGDLRFRPSIPPQPWQGTLNASKIPPACMQTRASFLSQHEFFPGKKRWMPRNPLSEDCLYLTVVAPDPVPLNAAVMVWIHGGGFYSGSNTLSLYDHKTLASEENVIVASMQYRLGVFGFLSLERELNGNAGLFDQALALQWIKNNIAAFGGNPNSITVFGESAGAASVSHHLLSPVSSNLFSRAIMQSGVATAAWATDTGLNMANSLNVAKRVGCPKELPLMVKCLQRTDADLLLTAQETIPRLGLVSIPFCPVVDGKFIVRDPLETLKNGLYDPKNVIIGVNENEGSYFLLYYAQRFNYENVTVARARFLEEIPKIVATRSPLEIEAIVYEYTDWSDPNGASKNLVALEKILGDSSFTCSSYEFAKTYSERSNLFFYHYKHRSPLNQWPSWGGALHGDEIAFIFGEPLDPRKKYAREQIELSRRMMRYWANFARTGDPNCVTNHQCQNAWPLFEPDNLRYINLDVNRFSVSKEPVRARQCMFWQKFLPKVQQLSGMSLI
ncbi:hypothetical protein PPYR_04951 [Photinus pyralis]|uniref:Carboxylic ester hydrolase n=2 Tax=Photinus pyralis TaxID=7054 RepID=A0A5N4AZJ6_PHOPY|nr:acetylcholinesterase-like [Photinus pyralis]KAB0802765.1 hypothetical protein PPYR_04951 [Photinus pyralis]